MKQVWVKWRLMLGFALAPVTLVGQVLLIVGTALLYTVVARVSRHEVRK